MFAGHIGVALAVGRVERRVNIGVFVAATLLLDAILWACVLLGWESLVIPANFSSTHQPEFTFPYSHGLVGSLCWSVLAAFAGFVAYANLAPERARNAALVAAVVFSHWLLDALVHQAELPLTGQSSLKVGLGLWHNNMPVALVAESALLLLGLGLFLPGNDLSRSKSRALVALCLVILAFTVAGMTIAPPPPSAQAMAASSLVTIVLVSALVYWLGKRPDTPRVTR